MPGQVSVQTRASVIGQVEREVLKDVSRRGDWLL